MSEIELNEICCNIQPILRAVNLMLDIVKWSVPMLLIVLGTVDMFKAVASGDEKETKEAQDNFIKRLLYGLLIFLIPFLVNLILNTISDNITVDNQGLTDMKSWVACWEPAINNSLNCTVKQEGTVIPDYEINRGYCSNSLYSNIEDCEANGNIWFTID